MFSLGRVCSASVGYVEPRVCSATHHAQPRVSPASGMFSLGPVCSALIGYVRPRSGMFSLGR
eukprot:1067530-Pyramimonas_sp.AAC.1